MTYHIPVKEKWEFDESVTDIFENMLSRSIPQYEVMRDTVTNISSHFLGDGVLVDIGCSRGDQISRMVESNPNALFHGVECSKPMFDACINRFNDYKNIKFHNLDLRKDWIEIDNIDVCHSILTLQFIPMEYRLNLLKSIYDSIKQGGCLILVEKIIGGSACIDSLMTEKYYDFKSSNGYSDYEIDRKRLSLEGVLVPVTAKWNEELLSMAGFKQIDCFWRWLNFAAWIAIK